MQQQSIDDRTSATRQIRKMPSVLGEDNRSPSPETSTQHRLKEWCVLMSVQDLSAFAIGKFPESPRTATIDSRAAMQMFNGKSILPEPLTDLADRVQHRNNAVKFVAHATHHLVHQDLGPANSIA